MELENQKIHKFLKNLRFKTMENAKMSLSFLLQMREPTINDLRKIVGQEAFSFGDNYFWDNLHWDLLSNKYGAAHRYDTKTKKSYFVLQLPTPIHISKGEN